MMQDNQFNYTIGLVKFHLMPFIYVSFLHIVLTLHTHSLRDRLTSLLLHLRIVIFRLGVATVNCCKKRAWQIDLLLLLFCATKIAGDEN